VSGSHFIPHGFVPPDFWNPFHAPSGFLGIPFPFPEILSRNSFIGNMKEIFNSKVFLSGRISAIVVS
jgi:hypothetical protein